MTGVSSHWPSTLMQDGSDFLVSMTKQAAFSRLEVSIENAAGPELQQVVFRPGYGAYLFDVLFSDMITLDGTKEVGDVAPVKVVACDPCSQPIYCDRSRKRWHNRGRPGRSVPVAVGSEIPTRCEAAS
jgi:hypothetical protein